jgi:hypothetical protein
MTKEEIIIKLKELSKERWALTYIAHKTWINVSTIKSWVYANKQPWFEKLQLIRKYFYKMDNNKYFE